MTCIDTQDLYDLADDLTDNLVREGELEGYLVFLWQELERLDPEKWGAILRVELADMQERMEEEE
jgi:hypothetical protein